MLTCYEVKDEEYFKEQLPYKPYSTDELGCGVRVLPRDIALRRKYIQLNPPCMVWAMVLDLDYPTWPYVADDVGLPQPTFFVGNRENGHAHLIYALNNPICTSDAARRRPIEYLEAIERAYIRIFEADPLYAGLMAKNPWRTDEWKVYRTNGNVAYDLEFLADYVTLESRKERPVTEIAGLGRNCYIFDKVRLWAYSAVRRYWTRPGEWHSAVETQCQLINREFTTPLYYREIRGIARSIADWTWKRHTREGFSESQRGRIAKRWDEASKKPEGLTLLRAGMKPSDVAEMLGVTARAVRYWRDELLRG